MRKILFPVIFFLGFSVGFFLKSSSITSQKDCDTSSVKHLAPVDLSSKSKPSKRVKDQEKSKKLSREFKVTKLLDNAYTLEKEGINNPLAYLDAINLYEEAVAINPDDRNTLSSYSNALILAKEYDKAFDILNRCIDQFPKDELCNANLTNLFIDQSQNEEALKSIERCLKNTPNNKLCIFNKASSYAASGKYSEAIKILKSLLISTEPSAISMDKGFVYGQIATYWSIIGSEKESLKYYRLACDEGDTQSCNILRSDYEK